MLGKGPRGSLRGHGSARINSHGKIGDVSGSAAITGGKKKFAGAYGVDLEVTGTFNRETYGLTVTLSGRMRY
jgi:polyisoprenoid-binding protein YceI